MTDRTPDQINHNLNQVFAIASENTIAISNLRGEIAEMSQGISEMAATVTELATYTRNRTRQHDEELDDHDIRVERLERDHTEHADRMEKLEALLVEIKEERKDIRQILQMMAARFAGEPPTGDNN